MKVNPLASYNQALPDWGDIYQIGNPSRVSRPFLLSMHLRAILRIRLPIMIGEFKREAASVSRNGFLGLIFPDGDSRGRMSGDLWPPGLQESRASDLVVPPPNFRERSSIFIRCFLQSL